MVVGGAVGNGREERTSGPIGPRGEWRCSDRGIGEGMNGREWTSLGPVGRVVGLL